MPPSFTMLQSDTTRDFYDWGKRQYRPTDTSVLTSYADKTPYFNFDEPLTDNLPDCLIMEWGNSAS